MSVKLTGTPRVSTPSSLATGTEIVNAEWVLNLAAELNSGGITTGGGGTSVAGVASINSATGAVSLGPVDTSIQIAQSGASITVRQTPAVNRAYALQGVSQLVLPGNNQRTYGQITNNDPWANLWISQSGQAVMPLTVNSTGYTANEGINTLTFTSTSGGTYTGATPQIGSDVIPYAGGVTMSVGASGYPVILTASGGNFTIFTPAGTTVTLAGTNAASWTVSYITIVATTTCAGYNPPNIPLYYQGAGAPCAINAGTQYVMSNGDIVTTTTSTAIGATKIPISQTTPGTGGWVANGTMVPVNSFAVTPGSTYVFNASSGQDAGYQYALAGSNTTPWNSMSTGYLQPYTGPISAIADNAVGLAPIHYYGATPPPVFTNRDIAWIPYTGSSNFSGLLNGTVAARKQVYAVDQIATFADIADVEDSPGYMYHDTAPAWATQRNAVGGHPWVYATGGASPDLLGAMAGYQGRSWIMALADWPTCTAWGGAGTNHYYLITGVSTSTGSTTATITCSTSHNLVDGDVVAISFAYGPIEVNGAWTISNATAHQSAGTFTIMLPTVGSGIAYTTSPSQGVVTTVTSYTQQELQINNTGAVQFADNASGVAGLPNDSTHFTTLAIHCTSEMTIRETVMGSANPVVTAVTAADGYLYLPVAGGIFQTFPHTVGTAFTTQLPADFIGNYWVIEQDGAGALQFQYTGQLDIWNRSGTNLFSLDSSGDLTLPGQLTVGSALGSGGGYVINAGAASGFNGYLIQGEVNFVPKFLVDAFGNCHVYGNLTVDGTSSISGSGGPFLPLAGGTMTGTLAGTNAAFTGPSSNLTTLSITDDVHVTNNATVTINAAYMSSANVLDVRSTATTFSGALIYGYMADNAHAGSLLALGTTGGTVFQVDEYGDLLIAADATSFSPLIARHNISGTQTVPTMIVDADYNGGGYGGGTRALQVRAAGIEIFGVNLTTSGIVQTGSTMSINSNTVTWPNAAITVARSDAAQTFTGVQTFSSAITANAGLTVTGDSTIQDGSSTSTRTLDITASHLATDAVIHVHATALTSGLIFGAAHDTTTFSGNAIEIDLASGSGSFTGNFLVFKNSTTTSLAVDHSGNITTLGGGSVTISGTSVSSSGTNDNIVMTGGWQTWSPTVTGTVGNATVVARYFQMGKTVFFTFNFTVGSTTTVSATALTFTLPVAATANAAYVFPGFAIHGSTYYNVTCELGASGTTIAGGYQGNLVKSTVPFTWATGDQYQVSGTYETA